VNNINSWRTANEHVVQTTIQPWSIPCHARGFGSLRKADKSHPSSSPSTIKVIGATSVKVIAFSTRKHSLMAHELCPLTRRLKGVKLWVITDAVDEDGNRYVTTILLPEEY
jgi:hypothetical protein